MYNDISLESCFSFIKIYQCIARVQTIIFLCINCVIEHTHSLLYVYYTNFCTEFSFTNKDKKKYFLE